jgi:hypothetical protein
MELLFDLVFDGRQLYLLSSLKHTRFFNIGFVVVGDENIEMFLDDYIDTISDIPPAHFSFLLKRVIPTEVLVSATIMQSDQLHRLNNQDLFRVSHKKALYWLK